MRKLIKAAKEIYAMAFGYSVHSMDWDAQHFAATFKEALEWAACYPDTDFICIRRCVDYKMVAIRGL